eukprot:748261-Hanusia_phi.AAC.1
MRRYVGADGEVGGERAGVGPHSEGVHQEEDLITICDRCVPPRCCLSYSVHHGGKRENIEVLLPSPPLRPAHHLETGFTRREGAWDEEEAREETRDEG